jgi:hypothetical protein
MTHRNEAPAVMAIGALREWIGAHHVMGWRCWLFGHRRRYLTMVTHHTFPNQAIACVEICPRCGRLLTYLFGPSLVRGNFMDILLCRPAGRGAHRSPRRRAGADHTIGGAPSV